MERMTDRVTRRPVLNSGALIPTLKLGGCTAIGGGPTDGSDGGGSNASTDEGRTTATPAEDSCTSDETISDDDPLTMTRVSGDDTEAAKRTSDFATEYSRAAAIVFDTIGVSESAITVDELRDLLGYVDDADVDVITASDLWSSIA